MTLPSLFFGGLFSSGVYTLPGVNWIQYLSPIRFGFEGLMDAEYRNTVEERALTLFNLNMGYCLSCVGLVVLAILSRIVSLIILRINVKYTV